MITVKLAVGRLVLELREVDISLHRPANIPQDLVLHFANSYCGTMLLFENKMLFTLRINHKTKSSLFKFHNSYSKFKIKFKVRTQSNAQKLGIGILIKTQIIYRSPNLQKTLKV